MGKPKGIASYPWLKPVLLEILTQAVSQSRTSLGCFPNVPSDGFKSSKVPAVEVQRQGTKTIKQVHYWIC